MSSLFVHVDTVKYSNKPMKTFEVMLCNLSSWRTEDLVNMIREVISRKAAQGFAPVSLAGQELPVMRMIVSDSKKALKGSGWRRDTRALVTSSGSHPDGSIVIDIAIQHPEHLSDNVAANLVAAAESISAPDQLKGEIAVTISNVLGGGGSYRLRDVVDDLPLVSERVAKKRLPTVITKARLLEKARRRVIQAERRVRSARYDVSTGAQHWSVCHRAASKTMPTWSEGGIGQDIEQFQTHLKAVEEEILKRRTAIIEEATRLLEGGQ